MVAISAGFCEEVLYRMFVYEFTIQYIGVIGSLLFTNVIFAITHFDMGMKNLVGAFILGIVKYSPFPVLQLGWFKLNCFFNFIQIFWLFIFYSLMSPLVIILNKILDSKIQIQSVFCWVQINVIILDWLEESFHMNVVCSSAFTVHAYPDFMTF